jgi:hypothetical protein
MADIDEIIDYIKSLKKGFDKDLFQSKIDELASTVDAVGLEYEDFHTLFKVWMNLSLREYLIRYIFYVYFCLLPFTIPRNLPVQGFRSPNSHGQLIQKISSDPFNSQLLRKLQK